MMQAGIFTGYFPYGLEETAKKIRALDFNTVQLDLHFKDIDLSAGQITKDKAKKVRDVFRDHNLPICCISGYTNIIHPDKAEREKRVGYLKEMIRHARDFGSRYVISETGTYNTNPTGSTIPRTRLRKVSKNVVRSSRISRRRPTTTARFSFLRPMSTTLSDLWKRQSKCSHRSTILALAS